MKYAYTFAEIAAAEKRAIESGTDVPTLMERAGRALADAAERAMRACGADDAVFLMGGGNNGGDGFVAARLLRERGYDVAAVCLAQKLTGAAADAREKFPGEVFGVFPRRHFRVAVDCLFGTGLARPIEGAYAAAVDFLKTCDHVISCDVPSGLREGGLASGPAVRADETVTMGGLKTALLLSDGADLAGEIEVAEIGLPLAGGAEVWEAEDVAALFPKRRSHSNKGDYGTVSVLAGYGSLGAPLLAAGAALKSGAGYTELRLPHSGNPATDEMRRTVIAAKYPACIVKLYAGEPLTSQAVAFGMGATPAVKEMLEELLATYRAGTLVLDADALNALSAYGTDLLRKRACPVVLTPHIKEFSRLTDRSVEEILKDPIGCAKSFAAEYGVTVVLKNNRTVITDGTRVAISCTGSPALAKGGSGDVLSGLLAGTCARGVPPYEASVAACYLLGRAGESAAKEMGEYAPDGADVIRLLPRAIRSLESL